MKYKLEKAVTISSGHPLYGRFKYAWEAGTHKPKSEQEREALDRLVSQGFAEEVPETKAEKAATDEEG